MKHSHFMTMTAAVYHEKNKKINNKGTSLIELVASITIFSIICFAALSFFSFTVNSYSAGMNNSRTMFEARLITYALNGFLKNRENIRMFNQNGSIMFTAEKNGVKNALGYNPQSGEMFYIDEYSSGGITNMNSQTVISDSVSSFEVSAKGKKVEVVFEIKTGNNTEKFTQTAVCDLICDTDE